MRVLGIETASTVCAVAVVGEDMDTQEQAVNLGRVHSEKLFVMIQQVLAKSGMGVDGLDGVGVSIGPGSFTGLRIGLSAGKGLAWGCRKPLVPVPTFEALARHVANEMREGEILLTVLPARREESYYQLFERKDDVQAVAGPAYGTHTEIIREIPSRSLVVAGEVAEGLRSVLTSRGVRYLEGAHGQCSAASVADLALRMLQLGNISSFKNLEPMYIKEFETKA